MGLPKASTAAALTLVLAGGALVGGGSAGAGASAPAPSVIVASPAHPGEVTGRADPRRSKYVPLDATLARKCMKKLRFAVQYGGGNVANAIGLLEVEVSSFEGQYASLKDQVVDMALHESHNTKADLRRLDNELWRGLKMWNSGDKRKAVQWWNAVLRTELLPSIRTYVGAFRAKAETLSREAKAALTAMGKTWVINPDVDDRLERSFDRVQAGLNAAWKIATKRARR